MKTLRDGYVVLYMVVAPSLRWLLPSLIILLQPGQTPYVSCCLSCIVTQIASQTFSAVLTVILALALYPEKQVRAHAEIDAIVGAGRLPTLDDKGSLPYVDALIKESIRWHPAVPLSMVRKPSIYGLHFDEIELVSLGLARRTAQDDVYGGKQTVIWASRRGILPLIRQNLIGHFIPKGAIIIPNIWY